MLFVACIATASPEYLRLTMAYLEDNEVIVQAMGVAQQALKQRCS